MSIEEKQRFEEEAAELHRKYLLEIKEYHTESEFEFNERL